MEGDYLTAELVLAHPGLVHAVVLDEPNEEQVLANYRAREPDASQQCRRVRVSVLVGARLADRARDAGMPILSARPWTNQLDRIHQALCGLT
jgi:hypothetical protein